MIRFINPTLFFTGALLLLISNAHAQLTFSVGTRAGLNITTYDFASTQTGVFAKLRFRFEGGIMVSLSNSGHFSLQPAVLYSQKERTQATSVDIRTGANLPSKVDVNLHNKLNYLTLPVNLAYSQQSNGQGLQVFAGPYLGMLLSGKNETALTQGSGQYSATYLDSGPIDLGTPDVTKNGYFAQQLDLGLQTGLGYRRQGLLVQLGYSWGLRNLTARYAYQGIVSSAPYYNRALQLSFTYLFGLKE